VRRVLDYKIEWGLKRRRKGIGDFLSLPILSIPVQSPNEIEREWSSSSSLLPKDTQDNVRSSSIFSTHFYSEYQYNLMANMGTFSFHKSGRFFCKRERGMLYHYYIQLSLTTRPRHFWDSWNSWAHIVYMNSYTGSSLGRLQTAWAPTTQRQCDFTFFCSFSTGQTQIIWVRDWKRMCERCLFLCLLLDELINKISIGHWDFPFPLFFVVWITDIRPPLCGILFRFFLYTFSGHSSFLFLYTLPLPLLWTIYR